MKEKLLLRQTKTGSGQTTISPRGKKLSTGEPSKIKMNGRNKNPRRSFIFGKHTHRPFSTRNIIGISCLEDLDCYWSHMVANVSPSVEVATIWRWGSYENRKLTTSFQTVHNETRHESTAFQTEAFMNMFETDDASPFVGGSTQAPFLKRSLSAPAIAEHVSLMKVDQQSPKIN